MKDPELNQDKSEDQVEKKEQEDNHLKGVLYFNLYVLGVTGLLLTAQVLYLRLPNQQPEQLIFGRNLFGTLVVLLQNNVEYKKRVYDDVPAGSAKNLFLRCLQAATVIFIDFSIVKYLTLVYQGIARNMTPIATMIMAAYMNNERISTFNAVFTIVSLGGVILIFAGFDSDKTFIEDSDK